MITVSTGWDLEVDVSTEWLFIRLHKTSQDASPIPPLADRVWSLVEQHQIYRVVVEFADDVMLTSHLVGQLVLLHKRFHRQEGVLRICGMSEANYQVLEVMQLHTRFPNYRTREYAVMGYAD